MKQFKVIGSLWLLFGTLLSFGVLWIIMDGGGIAYFQHVYSRYGFGEIVVQSIEFGVVLLSALSGLAVLRRWRWSRPGIGVVAGIWLLFSTVMILSADGTVAQRLVWFALPFLLALYSLIVVLFVKYEARAA